MTKIGSRVEVTKLPQVLIAEKRLEECLLSNEELLNTLCQISEHTHAQDLCGDIREHFKYYHIDLKNEARTRLEMLAPTFFMATGTEKN